MGKRMRSDPLWVDGLKQALPRAGLHQLLRQKLARLSQDKVLPQHVIHDFMLTVGIGKV